MTEFKLFTPKCCIENLNPNRLQNRSNSHSEKEHASISADVLNTNLLQILTLLCLILFTVNIFFIVFLFKVMVNWVESWI